MLQKHNINNVKFLMSIGAIENAYYGTRLDGEKCIKLYDDNYKELNGIRGFLFRQNIPAAATPTNNKGFIHTESFENTQRSYLLYTLTDEGFDAFFNLLADPHYPKLLTAPRPSLTFLHNLLVDNKIGKELQNAFDFSRINQNDFNTLESIPTLNLLLQGFNITADALQFFRGSKAYLGNQLHGNDLNWLGIFKGIALWFRHLFTSNEQLDAMGRFDAFLDNTIEAMRNSPISPTSSNLAKIKPPPASKKVENTVNIPLKKESTEQEKSVPEQIKQEKNKNNQGKQNQGKPEKKQPGNSKIPALGSRRDDLFGAIREGRALVKTVTDFEFTRKVLADPNDPDVRKKGCVGARKKLNKTEVLVFNSDKSSWEWVKVEPKQESNSVKTESKSTSFTASNKIGHGRFFEGSKASTGSTDYPYVLIFSGTSFTDSQGQARQGCRPAKFAYSTSDFYTNYQWWRKDESGNTYGGFDAAVEIWQKSGLNSFQELADYVATNDPKSGLPPHNEAYVHTNRSAFLGLGFRKPAIYNTLEHRVFLVYERILFEQILGWEKGELPLVVLNVRDNAGAFCDPIEYTLEQQKDDVIRYFKEQKIELNSRRSVFFNGNTEAIGLTPQQMADYLGIVDSVKPTLSPQPT